MVAFARAAVDNCALHTHLRTHAVHIYTLMLYTCAHLLTHLHTHLHTRSMNIFTHKTFAHLCYAHLHACSHLHTHAMLVCTFLHLRTLMHFCTLIPSSIHTAQLGTCAHLCYAGLHMHTCTLMLRSSMHTYICTFMHICTLTLCILCTFTVNTCTLMPCMFAHTCKLQKFLELQCNPVPVFTCILSAKILACAGDAYLHTQ